jgi:hypothetical protein
VLVVLEPPPLAFNLHCLPFNPAGVVACDYVVTYLETLRRFSWRNKHNHGEVHEESNKL